jgi:TetR/AcrR family transcriptional regulator of autoinduction and epiphytic fitness
MIDSTKVDGRRARGLRTRDTIVDALLDLVSGGEIAPTAQQIANQAGVSVRSVYQHFTDVEGLFRQASAQLLAWANARRVDIDTSLCLDERLRAFVGARSEMLEALTPFSKASQAVEASSHSLREGRLDLLKEGHRRMVAIFEPELRQLPLEAYDDVLVALDMITNLPAWDQVRSTGASIEQAARGMEAGIRALLGVKATADQVRIPT